MTVVIHPRVLIFGTTYEDNANRATLTDQWIALTGALNPDCDLLIVDSRSPHLPRIAQRHPEFVPHPHSSGLRAPRMLHVFPDNIGHLSRNGRDGWGRALCYGLQAAIDGYYDYVAHIEGDSLFRLPTMPIIRQMIAEKIDTASTPVFGMRLTPVGREEVGWVETGLMFFSVEYLRRSGFIAKYAWPSRKRTPTPEIVVRNILEQTGSLRMMPWKALRRDKNQFTDKNILDLDLDWVTHCDTTAHGCTANYAAWDRFFEANMPKRIETARREVVSAA